MKFLDQLDFIIEGVGSHRNLPNIKIIVHNENILDVLDQFFVMKKIVEYSNYLLEEKRIVIDFNKNIEDIMNSSRIDKKSKISLIEKEKKIHEKTTDIFRKKAFKSSFDKRKIQTKVLGKNIGPITINALYNDKNETDENIRNFKRYVTETVNQILSSENLNLNQIKINFIENINNNFSDLDPKIFKVYFGGDSKFKRYFFLKGISVYIYNRNQLITDINSEKNNFSLIDSITHDLVFHLISDYDLFKKFQYDPIKEKGINPQGGFSVKDWIKEFHAVYYSQIFDETDNYPWNFPRVSHQVRNKVLLEMNLLEKDFLDRNKMDLKTKTNKLKEIFSKLNHPFIEKNYNEMFSIEDKFSDTIEKLNKDVIFYNKKILTYQKFFDNHMKSMLKYIENDKKKKDKSFSDLKITWKIFLEYIKDFPKLYKYIKKNPIKFPLDTYIISIKTDDYQEDFFRILSKGLTTTSNFLQTRDDYFDNFEPTIDFFIEKINLLVNNVNRIDNYNKYIKNKLVYEKN